MRFQKTILVAVIAAVGASALLLVRGCNFKRDSTELPQDTLEKRERSSAISHAEANQESLQALLDSYKTSIALYGKVVDQFGESVPDATVEIFVHSEYFGDRSGTDAVLKTDKEGKFSINGLTGSAIGASAMKEGYLRIPALTSRSSGVNLNYGADGTGNKHANPANPIVLELLKIGPTEPIVHVDKKRWKLPLDGSPQLIALDSNEGQGEHQIDLRFRSNTHIRELPGNNAYTVFDWSFEIRVSGGGLIWDESDAKFEAPASGYKEMVRYEYTATMPPDEWKRVRRGRYFVRFADNTYGRIQFDIDGGSDRRPLYLESWLNLTPGSRNLATENLIINVMDSAESGR